MLRTLCLVIAARGAAGFAICKTSSRTAALRSPVSDGETSQLVSMRSTVADSESSQQVEIKLAAPAAAAFVEIRRDSSRFVESARLANGSVNAQAWVRWPTAVMKMPTQSRMLECPYSTTTEERKRGMISHAVPVLRMLGLSVAH